MIANYIHKDELRLVWDWVRQGLERIRSKGHTEWIVEDIYCDCYEQRSMLWVFHDENDKGFAILQPNGKSLHVWCAYGFMSDEKINQITLSTHPTNENGIRIYEKFGFVDTKYMDDDEEVFILDLKK